MNNLYSLKLSGNKISSIELRSLNGLYTLNSLDLENNSISTIHKEAFANCSNIKDLNLFKNKIYQVPDAIKMIHSLNTVDIGGNKIQAVEEDSLASLPNLIGLKLDHNKIRAIDKNAFSRLSNLQILNLGGNRIGEIERGSFNQNKKLQAIRLDANNITDIVGLFSELPSLRWLNVSDNKIQKFDYFLMPRSDLNENARNQEICCLISSRNLFDPRLDKIQYLHINCVVRGWGFLLNEFDILSNLSAKINEIVLDQYFHHSLEAKLTVQLIDGF